jgi:hypothetical protein
VLGLLEQGGLIRDVLSGMPDTCLVPRAHPAEAGEWLARLADRERLAQRGPPASVTAFSRREIARRYAALLDSTQRGAPRPSERSQPVALGAG